MALINCPECNDSVSDSALICPKCGYRLNYKAQGIKNIVVAEWKEVNKEDNGRIRPINTQHKCGCRVIFKRKCILSSIFIGFVISFTIWSCDNYMLYIPNYIYWSISKLHIAGVIVSNSIVVVASKVDFQWVADRIDSFRYIEIFINGIVFGCVICLARVFVESAKNKLIIFYARIKTIFWSSPSFVDTRLGHNEGPGRCACRANGTRWNFVRRRSGR